MPSYGRRRSSPLAPRPRSRTARPARMRYRVDGEPQLVIGIPLDEGAGGLLRVRLASTTSRTRSGRWRCRCSAPSVVTTLVGGALGYWLSRRTLRPLANVGLAAEAIAGGRLDTRLEGTDDPDLNVLVVVVQPHGPGPRGADRPRRPLRVRRQPRAAQPAHDALRVDRGAGLAARRDARRRRAVGPRPPGRRRRAASSSWSTTCSRSPASTPASPASSSSEVRLAELVRQAVACAAATTVPTVEIDADLAGDGRPGRQAPAGARHRQPPRQRREVRRRRHAGWRWSRPATACASPSRTAARVSRRTSGT